MSSYRWSVTHRCTEEQAIEVLEKFGFEEDDLDHGIFNIQINSWNLLKVHIKEKELEFAFFWMGNDTSEIYYDYLLNCGILIGQIMRILHDIDQEHSEKQKASSDVEDSEGEEE